LSRITPWPFLLLLLWPGKHEADARPKATRRLVYVPGDL